MIFGSVLLSVGINSMSATSDALKIECEWWGPSNAEQDASLACRGAIGIHVGDECLTRLADEWGNTVRNRLHASAYSLAGWLAGNWWRLRWEPETAASRDDVDWRMSHSMASAGDGYCWPNIVFASDGDGVTVVARATRGRVFGPVRYLNEVHTRLSARAFERGVDAFLTLVLSRLHEEGRRNSELAKLWEEVRKERGDPELASWRRLEAICGFDPGEAPDAIIDRLLADSAALGRTALDELAAVARGATAEVLNRVEALAARGDTPAAGGFRGVLPTLTRRQGELEGERPWQHATRLARQAREEWGLGDAPVTDGQLAELMGNRAAIFGAAEKDEAPMPLFLGDADGGRVSFYLNRAHPTGRRFAAARLIGDSLLHRDEGRLFPATEARTERQQFQRAFAQEFLCPYSALREMIPEAVADEEEIENAAARFNVSTRVIETMLVNRGELDRESLRWLVA